ncbi:unnamed protein product [Dicrocoelium dendriticum]|nr:unnamed protein product [Dicrocoelium dendriticum]
MASKENYQPKTRPQLPLFRSRSSSTSMFFTRTVPLNRAGAVDEDVFRSSFIPSTTVALSSPRELFDVMGRIKDNLSANPEEWEKRVDALRTLRAVVANGGLRFEEFVPSLKSLEQPIDCCLRDLRSSVVRETCITVAYLSQELRCRFDRFAESVLIDLIALMSNSAKVMASSGVVAIRFILENTHSSRLLPLITGSLSSKSNITRKHICEFLEIIFREWPANILEKHLGTLRDSLRRGIYDADQEARLFSRRAFPLFAAKFPDQANSLLQSIDAQKRKLIEGDLISSGLPGAVASGDGGTVRSRSNSQSSGQSRSTGNAVTRRPTRPILGATAIGANGTRGRPPVTTMNDYNTVGRYVRQGSVATTMSDKSRVSPRKSVSQSQPAIHKSCIGPYSSTTMVENQCMVVDFLVATGLRIVPDLRQPCWTSSCISNSEDFVRSALEVPSSYCPSPNTISATSREVSPSRFPHTSYGVSIDRPLYNPAGYAGGAVRQDQQSAMSTSNRIPRSQGTSREPSPARSITGAFPVQNHSTSDQRFGGRGPNFSSVRNRGRPSFSTMSDCGDSADPFLNNGRHTFESDDNFSETSSQCSDRSGRSVPAFYRQHPARVTDNLKEIITQLSSSQWSDRKDGLVNLQSYMRCGSSFSPDDIRRLTEIFAKMFADSQSKVVSLFMDVLQFFIKEYSPALRDWLYTLLIRLLNRQGTEVLGSHQKAIQETLFVLRSHFPLHLQFVTCCRFIMDNSQAPNMKVKVCLLEYLKDLILMMSPDMVSSLTPETCSAISRIITWSAEPKSADVRRMASRVIIKLYDLNSTSFATTLQSMPRAIQDRASEVLRTYQKTTTASGIPSAIDASHNLQSWKTTSINQDGSASHGQNSPGYVSPETMNNMIRQATEGLRTLTTGAQPYAPTSYRRSSSGPVTKPLNGSRLGSGAATSINANGLDSVSDETHGTVQSSGIMKSTLFQPCSPIVASPVQNTYLSPLMPSSSSPDHNARPDKPIGISGIDQGDGPKLRKPVIGYQTLRKIREMPPEDIMAEILQELSNHNERHEQRKACMLKLIKLLRDGTVCNFDEYFKPTLLILLETLGDDGYETRTLALKVLQELVRTKADLFHAFVHLFIMKILDACRDEEKSVVRSAEECAKTVAQCLPPDLCFSVLTPLIDEQQLQINLPAVKMQEHVVRNSSPDLIFNVLNAIIPGLISGCNHEDSAMRKASIFCLVAIALKIGDRIWEYLSELHISKRRLLKLYIDRALSSSTMSNESLGTRG